MIAESKGAVIPHMSVKQKQKTQAIQHHLSEMNKTNIFLMSDDEKRVVKL